MREESSSIIGLTGGIGSGKSTIAKIFKTIGIQSTDVDDIARESVKLGSYCLNEITKRYGSEILQFDGNLNRKVLREIIFNEQREKKWLESLMHPIIRLNVDEKLAIATSDYVLLVHPLLFETHQNTICRFTIAIDVSSNIQRQRVMDRDQLSDEQIEKILASQLSNDERLKHADFKITNNCDIVDLDDKALQLHKRISELL